MVRFRSIPVFAAHLRWRIRRTAPSALLAVALLASLTAQAQPAVKAAQPDPLDPKANVPALSYESAFSRYRLLSDEKPVSWRDANDIVTRNGGWRAYAREAQQPDPVPEAKPAATTPAAASKETAQPMPAGHGGHHAP